AAARRGTLFYANAPRASAPHQAAPLVVLQQALVRQQLQGGAELGAARHGRPPAARRRRLPVRQGGERRLDQRPGEGEDRLLAGGQRRQQRLGQRQGGQGRVEPGRVGGGGAALGCE